MLIDNAKILCSNEKLINSRSHYYTEKEQPALNKILVVYEIFDAFFSSGIKFNAYTWHYFG